MISLKEFFEKVGHEKNQQTAKKQEIFPKGQRVYFEKKFEAVYEVLVLIAYCICEN